MNNTHEKIEKNVGLMAVLIAVAVSFGGLAEIVPLMYQAEAIKPAPGVVPYPALELAGRDIYVREGCYNCHSQMVRTLSFETARYGRYSDAGESVYDRPFQWGSKRTGPDLARVGGRYSDDWHRVHLDNPREVVPESNMPGFPWLARATLDGAVVQRHMQSRTHWWPTCRDWAVTRQRESDMFSGIITAVLMLLFLGGSIWVWRPERKAEFDAAAQLPLAEDEEVKS
jgi:cytochrome c oxidase cbb3-type subunit 2